MINRKYLARPLLTLMLTVSMAFPSLAATGSSQAKEDARNKISEYQDQKDDLKAELAKLESNKTDTESYLKELDSKIEGILGELDGLAGELEKTNQEIIVIKEDLEAANKDADRQYAALKARIQAIYESGDTEYLTVFIGAEDLKSALNESEYMTKINEYDYNLLTSLQKTRDEIAACEKELEEQRDTQQSQLEAYQTEKENMETVAQQRQEELDSLGSSISSLNYNIDDIQDKMDAQEKAIQEIEQQEEKAAQAAAAAKKKAASAASASRSTSSAGTSSRSSSSASSSSTTSRSSSSTTASNSSSGSSSTSQRETSAPETETEKQEETKQDSGSSSSSSSYSGERLTAYAGVVYGPSGKETYYNLDMSGIVSMMRARGFSESEYPYWVRDDGCKMLGSYIMVAANLNVHPRGTTVATSLGTGLVCDTGGFAAANPYQLDIATTW